MRIARTVSRETINYETAEDPTPAEGEALIRIHNVTLCGTDLHIWEDDYATELPIIQGHEFAGVIEQINGTSDRFSVGDRIAVSPMFFCGECYACSIGRVNACTHMSVYGCYEDGSLVELMSVPLEKLYPVPDALPMHLAPLSEPMSIAMQAVNRGRPVAGETAVVLGCGPIGLLATLYLTELGVQVIAADTVEDRCAFAQEFGANETFVVDPSAPFPNEQQAARIAELTAGQGPSLIIEATGQPSSLGNAIQMVATAGRVVQVGISDKLAELSMRVLPVKEIDLIGSRNSQNLIGESLDLLGRHVPEATALVTHTFAFDNLNAAFETMRSRDAVVGKVLISMPGATI